MTDLEAVRDRHSNFEAAWDDEYMAPHGPEKAAASARDIPALLDLIGQLHEQVQTLTEYEIFDTAMLAKLAGFAQWLISLDTPDGAAERATVDLNQIIAEARKAFTPAMSSVTQPPAADLPDGSIVAHKDLVLVKDNPSPDMQWRASSGAWYWNFNVDKMLKAAARVLRFGYPPA